MSAKNSPVLEESVRIDAPLDTVWEAIGDVRSMSEWSSQVVSTRLRKGFDDVAVGVEFTNRNQRGDFAWVTHGQIVRYEPPNLLAFRITENYVIWSFALESDGEGTRVTHRRDAPEGISAASHEAIEAYFGGEEAFTAEMQAGMRSTLESLRSALEA